MMILACLAVLASCCFTDAKIVLSARDAEACVNMPGTPITRTMNATNGVYFYSPGFNSSDDTATYPTNVQCQWRFTTDTPEESIQIGFIYFDLEQTPECKNDVVKIYDGADDDTGTELVSYCNDAGTPAAVSGTAGNDMFVKFVSNDAIVRGGFQGRAGPPLVNTACNAADLPMVYTTPGPFETTNFPFQYPNDETCAWSFVAPAGQRVQVRFEQFSVEDCCDCDQMTVYDGANIQASEIVSFWGDHLPGIMTSTGTNMYITFRSDQSIRLLGFTGSVTFVNESLPIIKP